MAHLVGYTDSSESDSEHKNSALSTHRSHSDALSTFFSVAENDDASAPETPESYRFWESTDLNDEPIGLPCYVDSNTAFRISSPQWRPPDIFSPITNGAGITFNPSAYRHMRKKRRKQNFSNNAPTATIHDHSKSSEKLYSSQELSRKFDPDEIFFKKICSITCQIPSPNTAQTDYFYPRCSVYWPLIAISCAAAIEDKTPLYGVKIYRFVNQEQLELRSFSFQGGRVIWLHLLSFTRLAVAYEDGILCMWDISTGALLSSINVSGCCGKTLKSVSASSGSNSAVCFLIGGVSTCISLWDIRSHGNSPLPNSPDQKFFYSGTSCSTSDLLWLPTANNFASCSDTVHRDITDKSVAVWDLRLRKIISRQIYEERWGCSRMALSKNCAPWKNYCRFAVQTHGGGIVEVVGSANLKWKQKSRNSSGEILSNSSSGTQLSYHLERRWRYEDHETQGHPLGLEYSSKNDFLASGCWGADGPIIWRTPWKRKVHKALSQNELPLNSESYYFRTGEISRTVFVSDVGWLPTNTINPDGYALLVVKSNGNSDIYSFKAD